MFKKIVSPLILCMFCAFASQAQDPQYSQFYATPLYLNPAFAGSAMAPRVTFNYRNQWPSLNANFVTTSLSADYHIEKLNSGIGLIVNSDQQFSNLKTTEIGALYAYRVQLSENLSVNLGIQGSYVTRGINFGDYTFADQIEQYLATGAYPAMTVDPIVQSGKLNAQINYLDFSTGGILYSDRFWFGASVHHLNQPNQSFYNGEARLPMKIGVQAGYRIGLADYEIGNGLGDEIEKEKSVTLVAHYKKQGTADQLDLGAYLTYSPLVLGLWYRGIPLQSYQTSTQKYISNDAAIILVGYRQDSFSIGYSYDLTVSTLGAATGGAHEISLSYTFAELFDKKSRYRARKAEIKCPKF